MTGRWPDAARTVRLMGGAFPGASLRGGHLLPRGQTDLDGLEVLATVGDLDDVITLGIVRL